MKLLKKMSLGLISSGIADPAETIRRTLAANGLNNASATLQEDLLAVKRSSCIPASVR